jgi:hypothetical protein
MSGCLSDHELQAIADGEASAEKSRHAAECADCASRLDARRRHTDRVIDAAGSADVPPRVREAVRARLASAPAAGATTLRPVRRRPRWAWSAALAAAAALLLILVIVPGIDRRTTVSASEILGRSRTALSAAAAGIEVLTYDLELDGVLRDLIPAEQSGRFTVQEVIDHDHQGRYRISKLAANGQMVGGAADDPLRQTRVRYLRADGTGFLFRFEGAQPAALSVPELKRAALETFITLMQASAGQTMREVQRGGESCYQIEIQESAVPAGSLLALSRATAVVTTADARLVEFSASGSVADRPFTIAFVLRSRELAPASAGRDSDFDIAPQPGDVVLEGRVAVASSNPIWEIVSRALGAIPAAQAH